MNALLKMPDTVVPTDKDVQLATESSRILAANSGLHVVNGGFKIRLDSGVELILPNSAMRLLSHLLTEMSQGNAVTLIPTHANLTTQEAADYLGVSRPYLIGLLENRKINFQKVGTHRRIRFSDLQAFKDRQQQEHENAMNELAEQAQELKMGY
jgi:excisionase family DNA binding protein